MTQNPSTCCLQIQPLLIGKKQSALSMLYAPILNSSVSMKDLRLNMIDDYNIHMNSVELADQRHNQFCINYLLHNCKFWWFVFVWVIGIETMNAHILYGWFYTKEKAKTNTMPEKPSHLDFILGILDDMLGWINEKPAATTATPVECQPPIVVPAITQFLLQHLCMLSQNLREEMSDWKKTKLPP